LGTGKEEDQEKGFMKINILDAAEKDLEDGYLFYESRNPGLGSYFLDSLAYFGGIHMVVFGYHRLLAGRFPFDVYYRVIDNAVIVFAVLDCRRNPSWVRERLR
jgi:hypothetical protein